MVSGPENKIVLTTLIRESFKQEALASWTTYQETGRHLTGQEVRTG
jgi:predicted transcriptional regulator